MAHTEISLLNIARSFQALADSTRLRLLKALLSVQAHRGVCVCELVDALDLPQYHISRHLGQLKSAGWLQSERRGTWVYYRPSEAPAPWQAGILKTLSDLTGDAFQSDAERLQRRLALRQEGICIVGYRTIITDENEEES